MIDSTENYVWPSGKGILRGESIIPLYPAAMDASLNDEDLYELLTLVDAVRIEKAREKELKKRIYNEAL